MKSPIRWAGSKKQSVRQLRGYWTGGRYIEPFAGSGCLFFELEPIDAILGDLNWELTESLCALQADVEHVLAFLRGLETGEKAYYAIRARAPAFMRRQMTTISGALSSPKLRRILRPSTDLFWTVCGMAFPLGFSSPFRQVRRARTTTAT